MVDAETPQGASPAAEGPRRVRVVRPGQVQPRPRQAGPDRPESWPNPPPAGPAELGGKEPASSTKDKLEYFINVHPDSVEWEVDSRGRSMPEAERQRVNKSWDAFIDAYIDKDDNILDYAKDYPDLKKHLQRRIIGQAGRQAGNTTRDEAAPQTQVEAPRVEPAGGGSLEPEPEPEEPAEVASDEVADATATQAGEAKEVRPESVVVPEVEDKEEPKVAADDDDTAAKAQVVVPGANKSKLGSLEDVPLAPAVTKKADQPGNEPPVKDNVNSFKRFWQRLRGEADPEENVPNVARAFGNKAGSRSGEVIEPGSSIESVLPLMFPDKKLEDLTATERERLEYRASRGTYFPSQDAKSKGEESSEPKFTKTLTGDITSFVDNNPAKGEKTKYWVPGVSSIPLGNRVVDQPKVGEALAAPATEPEPVTTKINEAQPIPKKGMVGAQIDVPVIASPVDKDAVGQRVESSTNLTPEDEVRLYAEVLDSQSEDFLKKALAFQEKDGRLVLLPFERRLFEVELRLRESGVDAQTRQKLEKEKLKLIGENTDRGAGWRHLQTVEFKKMNKNELKDAYSSEQDPDWKNIYRLELGIRAETPNYPEEKYRRELKEIIYRVSLRERYDIIRERMEPRPSPASSPVVAAPPTTPAASIASANPPPAETAAPVVATTQENTKRNTFSDKFRDAVRNRRRTIFMAAVGGALGVAATALNEKRGK